LLISLEIIGTDLDRLATYDFVLTFHSNVNVSLYRFQDIARYWPTFLRNFPTEPLFNVPAERFPLESGNGAWAQKNRLVGTALSREKFDMFGYNTGL